MNKISIILSLIVLVANCFISNVAAAQDDQTVTQNTTTTSMKKLFAYAGPLLPNDWQV